MPLPSFYSQAFNFISSTGGNVDPRTGLFTVSLPLVNLHSSRLSGPALTLSLLYSPLSSDYEGFGRGFTLNLTRYDPDRGKLMLSTGEVYRISSSGNTVKQKKLNNFIYKKINDSTCQVIHKAGLIETLRKYDRVYVPVLIKAPDGRGLHFMWSTSHTPARLLKVWDEEGTVLCKVTYPDESVATTTFSVLPNDAEYGYSIIFKFTRALLVRATSNADATPRRWTFRYDDVGHEKRYRAITGITPPGGMVEEVTYYTDRGMAFPDIAGLPPLPCVYQHRVSPGGRQPVCVTQWSWTKANYLGKDAGLNQWQPDNDALLNILLPKYRYGSTAIALDTDGTTVLSTVTRRYNSYHLQTFERTLRDGKTYTEFTQYYAIQGGSFDKQPAQYALPVLQTEFWRDGRATPPRSRVTRWQFDEAGNPLRQALPDGTITEYVYYPPDGEGDACPADPHGFTRYLKSKTVTPRRVQGDEAAIVSIHTWKKRVGLYEESYAVVAETVTETTGNARVSITRSYYNDATDTLTYGREKKRVTVLTPDTHAEISFTRTQSFNYKASAQGLTQSETLTTHDGLTATRSTLRHICLGHLLSETDAQNVTVTHTYDKAGRVLTRTQAPGTKYENTQTWSYAFENGLPVTRTRDASGNQRAAIFDGAGRCTSLQQLDRDSTEKWFELSSHTYNPLGEVVSVTARDWLTDKNVQYYSNMTASHDGWGGLHRQSFSDGVNSLQTTDPVALTHTISAQGRMNDTYLATGTLITEFDEKSRLPCRVICKDTRRHIKGVRLSKWDGLGRLRLQTDELKRKTAWTYDAHGRVLTQTLANGSVVTRTYAPHLTGNQPASIHVTGKKQGAVKTWTLGTQTFDGLGRVTKRVIGGRMTTYTYQGASPTPSAVMLPSGKELMYTFIPELGNALAGLIAEGVTQTFNYDPLTGHMTTAEEGDSTIGNTLNPSGSLKAESFRQGKTLRSTAYTRTLSGAMLTYKDITGKKTAYEHDSFGRTITINDAALTVALTYDALGRIDTQAVTDAVTGATLSMTLAYDDFGQEITRTVSDSGGITLIVSQTWRSNGLLAGRSIRQNGIEIRQEQYGYNDRNCLTKYTATGSSLPQDAFGHLMTEQRYRYDPLNNFTTVSTVLADGKTDVASYRYANAQDPTQLTSVTHTHADYPAATTLTYDANGCMTRDEAGRTLRYDATGRLASVSGDVRYGYDALNRLVSQTVSSADTRQLYYRGDVRVNEVQPEQNCETRLLKAGHTCLGVSCGNSLTLIAGDRHDSLLWSRETDHKEGQQHSWSPYGSGKPIDGLPGYNGERADPVSGAYHLGNGYRAYSPMLMRFTCPDSLSPFGAGGINPYAYCAGDPVNHTDPSGHLSWQGIMGIVTGALGLVFSVFTAGTSIAAAGGVMAALGAASTTTLAVGGLGVAADITGIASGAMEKNHPQASSALGWVSMVTGLAGIAEGLVQGARSVMKMKTGAGNFALSSAVMQSDHAPLRLRGGHRRAAKVE